jgi:hypothetical protein
MNKNVKPIAPRALYQQKFTSARYNLLLVIGMTLINIVMLFLGGSSYFLFSATIPYSLSIDGAYYTGKLPEEFYTDMPADAQFLPDSYLAIMLGISIAILAVYFLCFLLSKKFKTGWMITAAVMFVLDTLYMLFIYGVGVDSVMDILLHAWVLYYLISGVIYGLKLKKLPEDEPAPVDGEGVEIEIPTQTDNKAE